MNFFDDVMQDLFEKKTFSIFEMIFKQKIENFCCVIKTRDDDWFYNFVYHIEQNYESEKFENDIIKFVNFV